MRGGLRTRARRTAALAAAGALLAAAAGCGGDPPSPPAAPAPAEEDPGPLHVHGLGEDPRDGALLIATHTGLFRLPAGAGRPARVGDRRQDTMGFTAAGPGRFLGSGHPDLRDRLPPFLGLIESRDGGRTWRSVSLLGRADFHVLEASERRVYGFGTDWRTRREQMLVSSDGGRRWSRRSPPEPLASLAIDPTDPDRVVAAGARGLHASDDGARTWADRGGPAGLLSWPAPDRLYLVDGGGAVHMSRDGGRRWSALGELGGEPAAFEATGRGALHAALHDGRIVTSRDGARWTVRSRP